MNPILFITGLIVFCWLSVILGQLSKPKPLITYKDATSYFGKLGRQTQLRTQAEKTRAIHDQLRESISPSQDHAQSAGDAAPRGRPA